jgi:tRNA G37 N-methylase TrmD
METVLQYIKGVLQQHDSVDHKSFKKEAMKEIRKALRQNGSSGNLQFA